MAKGETVENTRPPSRYIYEAKIYRQRSNVEIFIHNNQFANETWGLYCKEESFFEYAWSSISGRSHIARLSIGPIK